jgi:hypothetical protein
MIRGQLLAEQTAALLGQREIDAETRRCQHEPPPYLGQFEINAEIARLRKQRLQYTDLIHKLDAQIANCEE